MKKIIALAMVIGLLVYGCGSNYRWVRSNGDYSSLDKDEYECELQRAQYEQGQGGLKDLSVNIAGWKFQERCMKLRGYIWSNK